MPEQTNLRKRLRVLMAKPDNQACCDCLSRKPTWAALIKLPVDGASIAIGAFCCFQCSAAHRSLGTHISFVRSVDLDIWKEQEVKALEIGGNKVVNTIFDARLLNDHERISPMADPSVRGDYIRQKYAERRFYAPESLWAALIPKTEPIHEVNGRSSNNNLVRSSPRPLVRPNSMPQLCLSPKWASESDEDDPRRISSGEIQGGCFFSIPLTSSEIPREPERTRSVNDKLHHGGTIGPEASFAGGDNIVSGSADPLIEVPDLTPPFLDDHSERARSRRSSEEPILVDMRGLEPSVKPRNTRAGGGRRSSRRASCGGSSTIDLSSEYKELQGSDNAAAQGRIMRCRSSLQDSVYEIVQILEKEDANHQVSQRTGRRMIERRSSLTNLSQEGKPALVLEKSASAVHPAERCTNRERFLGRTLSPEEQLASQLKAVNMKPAPTEPTAVERNVRGSKESTKKSFKSITRRLSMPGISSVLTESAAICPKQTPARPRKSRSLRSKLPTNQSRSAGDDNSVASEHSDILSLTESSDRSTFLVRNNSVPDLAKEQPSQGQLSTFLASLVGDVQTSRPLAAVTKGVGPRLARRQRRSNPAARTILPTRRHHSAGDDVTIDSDIRSTE